MKRVQGQCVLFAFRQRYQHKVDNAL